MKATLLALVYAFLLAACSGSAVLIDENGAAVLDRALAEALADSDLPGMVALVTSGDSVLYRRALGVTGVGSNKPMVTDGIFRIHSMTKPITSLALMMLVERGEVDLDAPASRYLADLREREVLVSVDTTENRALTRPPSREITVRDLLRHTSGFAYTFSNHELLAMEENGGIGGRAQPILHDPGERWTYGVGTAFVGWIVEEVSKQALPDFLRAEIFEPLGMNDTSFNLGPSEIDRLVDLARRVDGVVTSGPRPDSLVGQGRGDGGLVSTADDYARFIQLILGRGELDSVRLLSEAAVEEMSRNQLEGITVIEQPGAIPNLSRPFPPTGAGQDGFSLAFQVSTEEVEDRRRPGSLSWSGLGNAHFWVDPTTGIGVVLLFQIFPFYDEAVLDVMNRFERVLYGEIIN
jgi:CubicO group peptidase (beta-lactamase class C family)